MPNYTLGVYKVTFQKIKLKWEINGQAWHGGSYSVYIFVLRVHRWVVDEQRWLSEVWYGDQLRRWHGNNISMFKCQVWVNTTATLRDPGPHTDKYAQLTSVASSDIPLLHVITVRKGMYFNNIRSAGYISAVIGIVAQKCLCRFRTMGFLVTDNHEVGHGGWRGGGGITLHSHFITHSLWNL